MAVSAINIPRLSFVGVVLKANTREMGHMGKRFMTYLIHREA